MPDSLRLPSFVVGPEPGGRGYTIRASEGLDQRGEWTSSMPMVLAEWSKRRIEAGFAGRFPVDGGAIALKARYFGEGDRGAVAVANGVFIPSAMLDETLRFEPQLFASIPVPDVDDAFARQPFSIAREPVRDPDIRGLEGVGLAWEDRHLVTHLDREAQALRVLAALDPAYLRTRIRGWSTTAQLVTRGEFRPIASINLLVTGPEERTPAERFRVGAIEANGAFSGEPAYPPEGYRLWLGLLAAGVEGIAEFPRDEVAQGLPHELARAMPGDVAWRFLEVVSNLGASYAAMVSVIAAVAKVGGDQIGAQVVQRYLAAIAQIEPGAISDLIDDLSRALSAYPTCLAALKNFVLWSGSREMIHELAPDDLYKIVRLLESQSAQIIADDGRRQVALQRLELLEDCFRPIQPSETKRQQREVLTQMRIRLGGIRPAGMRLGSDAEYHRAFQERLQFPLRQEN